MNDVTEVSEEICLFMQWHVGVSALSTSNVCMYLLRTLKQTYAITSQMHIDTIKITVVAMHRARLLGDQA